MIRCTSVEILSEHILALREECSNKPMIVLVGGCSRTGKTVLVSKLTENIKSSGISTTFIKLDSGMTRLEQNIHYTKFNGFLPKLLVKLFPGIFKKQVQKWLNQFKTFVEKRNS